MKELMAPEGKKNALFLDPLRINYDYCVLIMVPLGPSGKKGVFEMSVRKLPQNRSYLMGAGLEQMIQYLLGLEFNDTQFHFL